MLTSVPIMTHAPIDWLAAHGSVALFGLLVLGIAGLPVPGETLLIVAGVLIGQSRLQAVPTYAAAVLGSSVGITISYFIGRGAGVAVIERHGRRLRIPSGSVEQVRSAFRQAGKWGLMFGYFVPGVRHLTALVAGAASLEFSLFAMFAYVGAGIWSILFVTLGIVLGDRWQAVATAIEAHGWILGVLTVAAAVIVLAVRRRRRMAPVRRASQP